jgi:hypothetical protein
VSNHWVKNWLSRARQALVCTGSQLLNPASHCGSVMLPPP